MPRASLARVTRFFVLLKVRGWATWWCEAIPSRSTGTTHEVEMLTRLFTHLIQEARAVAP